MEHIADKIWPAGQRIGESLFLLNIWFLFYNKTKSCLAFCYQFRDGGENDCKAKEGNPFGPYWDKFNIDFDHNAKFGPLGFDMDYGFHKSAWVGNFPGDRFPVLAFTGISEPPLFFLNSYSIIW